MPPIVLNSAIDCVNVLCSVKGTHLDGVGRSREACTLGDQVEVLVAVGCLEVNVGVGLG